MIVSSVFSNDDLAKYPEGLRKAIEYLKSTDFTSLEAGRYDIDGDNLYALVQHIETAPLGEKRMESHKDYLDVQYVVSGYEVQGFAPDTGKAAVTESKPEKDIYFYGTEKLENETYIKLDAGTFTVYFPNDLHRPGCTDGASESVVKVVVKLKMTSLF